MPGDCSYCGQVGHTSRNCRRRKADAKKAKKQAEWREREQAPLRYGELDANRVRLAEELWDAMHGRTQ